MSVTTAAAADAGGTLQIEVSRVTLALAVDALGRAAARAHTDAMRAAQASPSLNSAALLSAEAEHAALRAARHELLEAARAAVPEAFDY